MVLLLKLGNASVVRSLMVNYLFNNTLKTKKMLEEWRICIFLAIFKNKEISKVVKITNESYNEII